MERVTRQITWIERLDPPTTHERLAMNVSLLQQWDMAFLTRVLEDRKTLYKQVCKNGVRLWGNLCIHVNTIQQSARSTLPKQKSTTKWTRCSSLIIIKHALTSNLQFWRLLQIHFLSLTPSWRELILGMRIVPLEYLFQKVEHEEEYFDNSKSPRSTV